MNKLNLNDANSFAYRKEITKEAIVLVICGIEYKALRYDTYIYDALRIAGYWPDREITYERIMWLRTWIRENIQHGHDYPINVRSISGAKRLIDKIIRSEYPDPSEGDDEDDPYPGWQQERDFQLSRNEQIFSIQK